MKFIFFFLVLNNSKFKFEFTQKVILLLSLLLASLSSAAQDFKWGENLGLDSSVHRGTLSNGLTYYVVRNSNPSGKIELALIEKAGGYHGVKPDDQGVAHLVEHIGFRATTEFPEGLQKRLMKIGLVLGRDYNASTSESTDYKISLPTKDTEALKLCLEALRSWAKGRLYNPVEVEQERLAVLNEMTPANSPSFMSILEARYQILDENEMYVPHVPIEISNMRTVSIDRLKQFDQTWYRPDQQAVIVVGDIEVRKVEILVRELFSDLQGRQSVQIPAFDYRRFEVPVKGRSKMIVVDHGKDNPSTDIKIYYKRKSTVPVNGPNSLAEAKIGMIDRLANELIDARFRIISKASDEKDIQGASARFYRRAVHPWAGQDAIIAHCTMSGTDKILDLTGFLLRETERIKRFGFSEDEFSLAKDVVKKQISGQENSFSSNSIQSKLEDNFIHNTAYRVLPNDIRLSVLDSLSREQINKTLKDWLRADSLDIDVVFSVGNPQDANIPTAAKTLFLVDSIGNDLGLKAFEDPNNGRFLIAPLSVAQEKVISTRRKSSKVSTITGLDATQLILPNGIKVIIKSLGPHDEHRKPWSQVNFKTFKSGGTSQYVSKDYRSASAAGQLVASSGLGECNHVELRRWINAQQKNGYLNVGPFITQFEEGISGIASLNNSENMLMMVYLYFVHPRADKAVFDEQFARGLPNTKSFGQLLEDTISEETANGPFDFTGAQDGDIDFDRAFEIYKERFTNPSEFTFVVTGYFDVEMIAKQAAKYLGAIPAKSTRPLDQIKTRPKLNPYKSKIVTIPGSSSNSSEVRIVVPVQRKISFSEIIRMRVLNEMLRDLLMQKLRTESGLVYSVFSTFARVSGYGAVSVTFVCSPENSEKAIVLTMDVLEELPLTEYDDSMFDTAKQTVENNMISELHSASFWIDYIELQISSSQKFPSALNLLDDVRRVSKQDIGETWSRIIDINQYSVFRL